MREIADVFGLTESRICQIHAQAILAIKSHLQKYDPYFVLAESGSRWSRALIAARSRREPFPAQRSSNPR